MNIFLQDNNIYKYLSQLMSDPQIYVRGFPKNCRETELKQIFGKFGQIVQVRLIRDYAFIVFNNKQQVENAVRQMDGQNYQDYKLRVEVAGRPRKAKGPQPNDECRYCRKLGHWQNDCPEYRQKRRSEQKAQIVQFILILIVFGQRQVSKKKKKVFEEDQEEKQKKILLLIEQQFVWEQFKSVFSWGKARQKRQVQRASRQVSKQKSDPPDQNI